MTEMVDYATPLLEALIPKIDRLDWDRPHARLRTDKAVAVVAVVTSPADDAMGYRPTDMFAARQVANVTVLSRSSVLAQLTIAFQERFPSDQSDTVIPSSSVSQASSKKDESGASPKVKTTSLDARSRDSKLVDE